MAEQPQFKADVLSAVESAKSSRSLQNLLSIPTGQFSNKPYNKFVETFVTGMTSSTFALDFSVADRRTVLQAQAMESLYAAANLNYCAEFHVLLQAIVYSITQSKTTLDIFGHLGSGGSYKLVKDWLAGLGGSELQVPEGFVSVGFDNEQRQLKSYLSRGSNRSTYEVLTNVVYARHSHVPSQEKGDFHFRNWKFPTVTEIQCAIDQVPDPLDQESLIKPHLLSFMNKRIEALVSEQRLSADPVDSHLASLERERRYLICPKCCTQMERRLHLCPNATCRVNVRQALQADQGKSVVSTEHIKVTKPGTLKSGTEFVYVPHVDSSTGVSLTRVSSKTSGEDVPLVSPADVGFLEPIFVNPNSHEAVRIVLRDVGKRARVKQCVGDEGVREWLTVVCDGLPYSLILAVMEEARRDAAKLANHEAGILHVDSMSKADLKSACSTRGLGVTGNMSTLRERLRKFLDDLVEKGELMPPTNIPDGEFDWVLPISGGLHWEMNIIQCIVKSLWPFAYKEFAISQGYTSPKQLDWAFKAKDHHRTYDELSRFTDGCFDELLRPYVLAQESGSNTPSAEGFFVSCKQFTNNHTYSWLLDLCTQYCFPLFMLRRGARHNDVPLFIESRRVLSPLLHARNHTTYQVIDMSEEVRRLSLPTDLRSLIDSTLFLSRSGKGDLHQALDAIVEELNANVKSWVSGEKDSNMWRWVIRNHEQLMKLRSKVFSALQLPDPKSESKSPSRLC